ncbi:MAG: IPT/TIG domain-containing protein, partial [Myxococcota bacterium]|nr:IPT/TIG domain-containing protein [Myxococcota bacterium]
MRALNLLYTALLFLVGCTAEGPPSARDYSSDVIVEQVSDVPESSGQGDILEGPSAASDTLEDGLFISSIIPKTSGTAGGQLVVVEGNAFVQGSEVWFGARRADEVTVYSETVIHARAPAHPPGQVDLRVITPDKTEAFAPETFIFRDEMAITSISPSVGPARGGTPVVVAGSGFTADTRVLLGGRLLINHQVVDGETVLGITPPSDVVGTGDILAFSSLTNAVAKDAFRFTQAPALDDLTPSSTLANTTIEVVLTGTALTAESTVFFGEMEAEIVYADQTGLIVNAPPQSAGLVDVRVDTIDGTSTLAESFMYIGEPTGGVELFHIMPKTGPTAGGHEVALTALGIENMVELEVKFGEKKATVVSVEPEIGRMRLLTPPGVGTVDISVTCPAGMGTLSAAYTYEDAAEINSITPTAGSSDGGETVTIVGDGVDLAQGVFIGALPATLISSAPDTLVVQTPPGSPGPADVVVVLP